MIIVADFDYGFVAQCDLRKKLVLESTTASRMGTRPVAV